MVLAGGIGNTNSAVECRAKDLGWKEEIWGRKIEDRKRQQITFYSLGAVEPPHTTMTTDMFAWVGGSASPHHINAIGHEATSLLELPADATHARAPARESRSLPDENGRRTSFIDTI